MKYYKAYLFSSLFLLLTATSFSQAPPTWKWAKEMNGFYANGIVGEVSHNSIVTDKQGNIYVSGIFASQFFDIGNDTLEKGTANAANAIYLIKYNSEGEILWSRRYGSILSHPNYPGSVRDQNATLDPEGNIILTGSYTRDLYLGSDSHHFKRNLVLTPGHDDEIFVAKIDTDGNTNWAKNIGGNRDESVQSICTDQKGNIYITGYYNSDTLSFAQSFLIRNNQYKSDNSPEYYTAKYNKHGEEQWIRGTTSSQLWRSILGKKVLADLNGDILVVGEYTTSSLAVGDYELENYDSIGNEYGSSDLFFIKYTPEGQVIWANSIYGTHSEYLHDVIIDRSNNIVISGSSISKLVDFGKHQLIDTTPGIGTHIFIAKFNPNFESMWAKNTRIMEGRDFTFLASDRHNNIYTSTGFDPWVPVTDMIMIRRLNPLGEKQEEILVSCGGRDYWGGRMATDSNDNVIIVTEVPRYIVPMTIGNTTITKTGLVVAKAKFDNSLNVHDMLSNEKSIQVYPNPASQVLYFSHLPPECTLHIKDVTGKTVLRESPIGNAFQCNIETLNPGIYIVLVKNKETQKTIKLIVHK